MTATLCDDHAHEETPLLSKQKEKQPTPLPKLQLSILMLLQLAEPMTSQCISPFINQLIGELDVTGGDERKIGYYAGLIQSLFFATEALFILQWSLLSDRIGRKPVLLTGSLGLCFSMIFFGLSKTFWGLVVSRCLVGLLNGNIGVMKSMVAELADSTNLAQAFSLMPVVWSIGATLGPFMGGSLARPHDRWPHIFSHPFWIEYPYFLPCAGSAIFSAFAFVISAIYLKETVKKANPKAEKADPEQEASEEVPKPVEDGPLPLRKLLVWPVIVSVANYGTLAFLEIAFWAIQPLFLSTPIEFGGLGQTPASIGLILGLSGMGNGIFQALFFAKIVRRWGTKRTFIVGLSSLIVMFILFPIINMIARQSGTSTLVWVLVSIQAFITFLVELSYGCIFMFITTAAPNRQSLGSTNGIGQLVASIVRAIGPASATSLFALSVERNWMGGYAVFLILIISTILSLFVADLLPENSWSEDE